MLTGVFVVLVMASALAGAWIGCGLRVAWRQAMLHETTVQIGAQWLTLAIVVGVGLWCGIKSVRHGNVDGAFVAWIVTMANLFLLSLAGAFSRILPTLTLAAVLVLATGCGTTLKISKGDVTAEYTTYRDTEIGTLRLVKEGDSYTVELDDYAAEHRVQLEGFRALIETAKTIGGR